MQPVSSLLNVYLHRHSSLKGILAIAFMLTSASPSAAEVIFLKNGKHIEGKIVKEDSKSVVIDVGIELPVTYYRDEIRGIEKEFPVDPLAVSQADAMEAKAVELIDQGKMSEGLDLMRQALVLAPSAQRHMNFGSILFGNGVMLFKNGQQEQGRNMLRQSEEALTKALAAFDKERDAFFMAQCFYLLGEMYSHAFQDEAKAKDYYTEAVALVSHPGATKALNDLK